MVESNTTDNATVDEDRRNCQRHQSRDHSRIQSDDLNTRSDDESTNMSSNCSSGDDDDNCDVGDDSD